MTPSRRAFGSVLGAMLLSARRSFAEDADAGAREVVTGAKLEELFAATTRARHDLRTLRARFTQERKLSLLATTITSAGQLTYLAPDRLRWELGPPDDVVYWAGPEGLSYRSRSSSATTAPAGSAGRALGDVRALLTGDLTLLRPRYVLGATRSPADVSITGTAKEASTTIRAFTLLVDKNLVTPIRARLLEGKTDTIDLVFSNVVLNGPVDPATMRP